MWIAKTNSYRRQLLILLNSLKETFVTIINNYNAVRKKSNSKSKLDIKAYQNKNKTFLAFEFVLKITSN